MLCIVSCLRRCICRSKCLVGCMGVVMWVMYLSLEEEIFFIKVCIFFIDIGRDFFLWKILFGVISMMCCKFWIGRCDDLWRRRIIRWGSGNGENLIILFDNWCCLWRNEISEWLRNNWSCKRFRNRRKWNERFVNWFLRRRSKSRLGFIRSKFG